MSEQYVFWNISLMKHRQAHTVCTHKAQLTFFLLPEPAALQYIN